jgi:hypothetical protein
LIIFLGVQIKAQFTHPENHGYSEETLRELYPDMSDEDRTTLMKETWSQPWMYESWVQFREIPHEGEYVNIHEVGFRLIKDQCDYPIDEDNFNIFVFGGSTTFGYGVADEDTIPSNIQEILTEDCENVCVYNFGRASYFSAQERVLLETLIMEDQVPDMAIFIDGLNDFIVEAELPLSERLAYYVRTGDYLGFLRATPLMVFIKNRLVSSVAQGNEDWGNEETVKGIISKWFINKKMTEGLAEEFGIDAYFVVQPVPTYNYDLDYHAIAKGDESRFSDNHENYVVGYPFFVDEYTELSKAEKENIIWLVNIQKGKRENLYVDLVHYNPEFSAEIAEEIVETVKSDVC